MKKLIILLCSLLSISTFAQVRFNITDNDATTGKRMKYASVSVRVDNGVPIEFIGKISFHEIANDAEVLPSGTSTSKKSVESYFENYTTQDKFINGTTKIYQFEEDVNSIRVSEYLRLKAINTYPQVANADPFWELIDGLCKEIITIRKINGEFNN